MNYSLTGTWISEPQHHNFQYKPKREGKGNSIQKFCIHSILSIISLPVSISLRLINRDAASWEKKSFPTLFPSSSRVIHHSNLFWKGSRIYFSKLWERRDLSAKAAPLGFDWGWKCPGLGATCPSTIHSGCLLHQNHVWKSLYLPLTLLGCTQRNTL